MIDTSEAILTQILGAIRSLSDRIDKLAEKKAAELSEVALNTPQSVEVSNRVFVHWRDALPVSVDLSDPQPNQYMPVRLTDGSGFLNHPLAVQHAREPTFVVNFNQIATGANRRIATIFNNSTEHLIRVWEVRLRDHQQVAVTGVPVFGDMGYVLDVNGGSPLAIQTMDFADSLPSGIEARTDASAIDFGAPIAYWASSVEELAATTGALQALLAVLGNTVYKADPPLKPITLIPSVGLSVTQRSSTTVGTISGTILFSVVPI